MDNAKTQSVLLDVLHGLFIDVEQILQLDEGVLHCDLDKVALSLKSRGLRVLLVDFPSLCSGLESSLESGDWGPLLGLPFFRKSGPTILRPLFTKIFNDGDRKSVV